jgi:hypothetical protein
MRCCKVARALLPRRRFPINKRRIGRSRRRKIFVIVVANKIETTNAIPLHHCQIPGGMGLIVSKSIPIMQRPSGRREFVSKNRNRILSTGDHSCTDSRRKTTTTPAKPANATAICAAIPRASPGSIVKSVQRLAADCGRIIFASTTRFAHCLSAAFHYRLQPMSVASAVTWTVMRNAN